MYTSGIEENKEPPLTFIQYKTFVLIYAGHVDYDYSEEEINYIHSISDIKTYKNMYSLFLSMSDYSSLKLILRYKDVYFNTYRLRIEIQNHILDLFIADGDYSRPEKVFLDFLNRMMHSYHPTFSSRVNT